MTVGCVEAQLGDAGTSGVAVEMKIDGNDVSACSAVETPPTSQRSQMVNSGRSPMATCSIA